MISQPSLEKFKKLYKQRFGEELSDAEALGRGNYLLNFGLAVCGHPLHGRKEEAEAELLVNQSNSYEKSSEANIGSKSF